MPDGFNLNLERYRKRAAKMVGGSPHAEETLLIPGIHPTVCPTLIFFNAFVQIKSEFPTTNFNGSSVETASLIRLGVSSADEIELFVKSEVQFPTCRYFSFNSVFTINADDDDGQNPEVDEIRLWANQLAIEVALIRKPMAVGSGAPAALDFVTWDNANRDTGTLFATPANFEDISGLTTFTEVMTLTDRIAGRDPLVDIFNPDPRNMDLIGAYSQWLEGAARIQGDNGPFFGVHFRILDNASNLSDNPDWTVQFDVSGIKPVAVNDALAFILTAELSPINE